jgi:hypothetical protein
MTSTTLLAARLSEPGSGPKHNKQAELDTGKDGVCIVENWIEVKGVEVLASFRACRYQPLSVCLPQFLHHLQLFAGRDQKR